MDYEAKIADLKGAIKIRADNRQSTSVLLDRMSKVRTMQIKKEIREDAMRNREAKKANR